MCHLAERKKVPLQDQRATSVQDPSALDWQECNRDWEQGDTLSKRRKRTSPGAGGRITPCQAKHHMSDPAHPGPAEIKRMTKRSDVYTAMIQSGSIRVRQSNYSMVTTATPIGRPGH